MESKSRSIKCDLVVAIVQIFLKQFIIVLAIINVGIADHVFVGTVEEIVKNIVPDEPNSSDADISVYKIRVDENLKGELSENIECSKHGGFKKDGTMMLIFSDRSKTSSLSYLQTNIFNFLTI